MIKQRRGVSLGLGDQIIVGVVACITKGRSSFTCYDTATMRTQVGSYIFDFPQGPVVQRVNNWELLTARDCIYGPGDLGDQTVFAREPWSCWKGPPGKLLRVVLTGC